MVIKEPVIQLSDVAGDNYSVISWFLSDKCKKKTEYNYLYIQLVFFTLPFKHFHLDLGVNIFTRTMKCNWSRYDHSKPFLTVGLSCDSEQ